MSTRSGKRIHSVVEETVTKIPKPKRKTRCNKQKENCENSETVIQPKKKHFVGYPSEEDNEVADQSEITKSIRKLQRSTLQELNGLGLEDSEKPIRLTRRTKKIEDEFFTLHGVTSEVNNKSKKKKTKNLLIANGENFSGKNKKKKKKTSTSLVVEDLINRSLNKSNTSVDSFHSAAGSIQASPLNSITEDNTSSKTKTSLKLSNSIDECYSGRTPNKSFDSTLKPCKVDHKVDKNEPDIFSMNSNGAEIINHVEKKIKKKKGKKRLCKENDDTNKAMINKRPSSGVLEMDENKKVKNKSKISKEKIVESEIDAALNNTFEIENPSHEPGLKNSPFDKITEPTIHNATYEKEAELNKNDSESRSSLISLDYFTEINSSKQKPNSSIKILNNTYDKTPDLKTSNIQEITSIENNSSNKMDRTFEKENPKLDSTFENEKASLDTTYDKTNDDMEKSSLSSNMTDDKSNSSPINITSDDSRENIVNTTPMLIESSIDESISSKNLTEQGEKSPLRKSKSIAETSHTPLKREGTFTKESGSPVMNSNVKTPSKYISLDSPGRTPFPSSKCSSTVKNVLNVTRSIEKSRKSSFADLPRATKVMFCSPVNNPVIINQIKGKVIKSNLKGSNKSFVFNESVSDKVSSGRKRSYTQSDADDVSVKRKRLVEDLQNSVDRLSRPRTTSASAKLQAATPNKQSPQNGKDKVTRKKLPNFAALHQKQFSKMESLDECQERKAKRARLMLTANVSVSKERTSPKDKDTKTKEVKKTETPVKSRRTLPIDPFNAPGYTRFGFKMNSDVNPFANTTKHDVNSTNNDLNSTKTNIKSTKTNLISTQNNLNSTKINFNSSKINLNSTKTNLNSKNSEPFRMPTKSDISFNGSKTLVKSKAVNSNELKRQTALPSLAGSTVRKEIAKQTVMREKSFTEKRNIDRKEYRTIIKGVRTNKRFELQMKMRNID